MVKSFQLSRTPEIIFGLGKRKVLSGIIGKYGSEILVITGSGSFKKTEAGQKLLSDIEKSVHKMHLAIITGEPTPEMIDEIVNRLSHENIELVVAIGGGSVIDGGKAVSAMLGKTGSVMDYLEGIGSKQPDGTKVPFIALPTTAGTGSEATKNAVLSRLGENGFKRSLRHDHYVPDIALIDPELNITCPKDISVSSGLDAITQLLESYVSSKSCDYTDALALSGLKLAFANLKKVWHQGDDLEARTGMSYAALISGITLANAGLGSVHGFASSLGGWYNISHGVICGTLLPVCTRTNLYHPALPESVFQKYVRVGKLLIKDHSKKDTYYVDLLLSTLDEWVEEFQLPRLSDLGVQREDLKKIAAQTDNKNNPVELSQDDFYKILESRY